MRRSRPVRFINDKYGQIRIMEALLASLLMLSTITLVPSQFGVEKTHFNSFYSEGSQVLVSLDSNGKLSSIIEHRNWTSLKKCIQSVLPLSLWFNISVFDENFNIINDITISNGGSISDEIIAINYICATSSQNYAVYIVRLQLAEVK